MTTTDPDGVFERAEALVVETIEDPSLLASYKDAHRKAQSLEHSGWKRRTGMRQNDIIMNHFKKAGSITGREAMIDYSIQSLTKRISELRDEGHKIISKRHRHPITGQDYVRYTLGEVHEA